MIPSVRRIFATWLILLSIAAAVLLATGCEESYVACHARGSGLYSRPDPRCTPGTLNPEVTQAKIDSTICQSGWTSTVRPPESITEPEKLASIQAYGDTGPPSSDEYDHDVPLELGGAVNDSRNLWPEPDYAHPAPFYANPKDHLEDKLHRLVCDGAMGLSQAQSAIASNWVAAYHRYG
jgi:hypothetical protein